MKTLIIMSSLIILLAALPSFAQEGGENAPAVASSVQEVDEAKAADIERFLDVTGALKMGEMVAGALMDQMSAAQREANQTLPDRWLKIVNEEAKSFLSESLYDSGGYKGMLVRLYDKYYSQEDIKGLLAFYETPLGQKTLEVTPHLMQESMEMGQTWAASLESEFQERIMLRLMAEEELEKQAEQSKQAEGQ